ncbi:unnamed protein product [Ectocarpus sp. 6 AP-2014]
MTGIKLHVTTPATNTQVVFRAYTKKHTTQRRLGRSLLRYRVQLLVHTAISTLSARCRIHLQLERSLALAIITATVTISIYTAYRYGIRDPVKTISTSSRGGGGVRFVNTRSRRIARARKGSGEQTDNKRGDH